jgi:hypothetical protein
VLYNLVQQPDFLHALYLDSRAAGHRDVDILAYAANASLDFAGHAQKPANLESLHDSISQQPQIPVFNDLSTHIDVVPYQRYVVRFDGHTQQFHNDSQVCL